MKKIIRIAMCVTLMSFLLLTSAFALTSSNAIRKPIVDSQNVEITVSSENLSEQKIEYIKQTILNGRAPSDVSPSGIFCLFGHDLETGIVEITQHYCYDTTPKCICDRYYYEVCRRSSCSYAVYTFLNSFPSFCH